MNMLKLRVNDIFTEVTVFKRDKDTGDKRNLVRIQCLNKRVTDELRLHMFGGDDIVLITGEVEEGIRIIVEGGRQTRIDLVQNELLLSFIPFQTIQQKLNFMIQKKQNDKGRRNL
jgi:hypothetical protein